MRVCLQGYDPDVGLGYADSAYRYSLETSDLEDLSEGCRLRKRYRRILKEEIALTLDDESEEAVKEEIRYLFGVFAR